MPTSTLGATDELLVTAELRSRVTLIKGE